MIKSFKDRDAERLFQRRPVLKLPPEIQRVALRRLRILDNAVTLGDLMVPPGNRFEKLRGDRAEQYSIRINRQWRICFKWQEGDAYDVEITDYH